MENKNKKYHFFLDFIFLRSPAFNFSVLWILDLYLFGFLAFRLSDFQLLRFWPFQFSGFYAFRHFSFTAFTLLFLILFEFKLLDKIRV